MLNKMFKTIKLLLLVLVWTATALMSLNYLITDRIASDMLGKKLSGMTGRPSKVGPIAGNYISSVELSSIEIGSRDGAENATSIKKVCASYSLASLLKGKLNVSDIEMADATVNIRRKSDNTFDFEDAADALKKFMAAPSSFRVPVSVDIARISLDNVTVNYRDEVDGRMDRSSVKLKDFKIYPKAGFMVLGLEGFAEVTRAGETLAAKTHISADVNLIRQSVRVTVESDRIDLASLNYVLSVAAPGYTVERGALRTSSIIDYVPGRLEIFGKASISDLAVKTPFLPVPLVAGALNFDFDENTVRLFDSKAGLPGFELSLEGAFSNLLDPAGFAFMVRSNLTKAPFEKVFAPIKQYLGNEMLSSYYSTGTVDMAVSLSGIGLSPARWDLAAELALADIGMTSGSVPVPLRKLNGKLSFAKGTLTMHSPLTFELAGTPFEVKGYLRNLFVSPVFDFALRSAAAGARMITDAADAAAGATAVRVPEALKKAAGTVGLAGRITGGAAKMYYSLTADLRNIVIKDFYGMREIGVNGAVTLRNNQIVVRNASVSADGATLTGGGELTGLSGAGRLRISAGIAGCDLSRLGRFAVLPEGIELTGIAGAKIDLAGRSDSLAGTVKAMADNVIVMKRSAGGEKIAFPLQALAVNARANGGKVTARAEAVVFGGKIAADGALDATAGKYSVRASIDGADALEFSKFNSMPRTAGGKISAKGEFAGTTAAALMSAAGIGTFAVSDARLYGDAFFGKTLAAAPEYNEMIFARAEGAFVVGEGTLTVKEARLENSLMKVSASDTRIGLSDLSLASTARFAAANGFSAEVRATGTVTRPDLSPTITGLTAAVGEKMKAEGAKLAEELKTSAGDVAAEARAAAANAAAEKASELGNKAAKSAVNTLKGFLK